jgi:hypothetical protein
MILIEERIANERQYQKTIRKKFGFHFDEAGGL